jgi:hypothetical protein
MDRETRTIALAHCLARVSIAAPLPRPESVCSNGPVGRRRTIDADVIATLQDHVIRPYVMTV